MSETDTPPPARLPEARVQARRTLPAVWVIPIVAALIAGFLAWRAIYQRGATIDITFTTADGLTAGQTKIRHKAVDLGTVRRITLSRDMQHVTIEADMRREADRFLTANARFWVVRPRLAAGNISGLETLLSGAFIEMDPGKPSGPERTRFTGLEEPPAVRSDEPGHTFILKADRVGSISSGSPVFFRDIAAGEVLRYEVHPAERKEDTYINVHVFVRAPYDGFVHEGSYFWNTSGVSVQLGAEGVRLQLESLQALLSGGIAFDTPAPPRDGPPSGSDAPFTLYDSRTDAETAGLRNRIPFVTYFRGSVRGLAVGAPVELFGIPIGSVTAIRLELDTATGQSRVKVALQVQPERVFGRGYAPTGRPIDTARLLVAQGMRVQLRSANLLTGQMLVAMDFFPDQKPGRVGEEDGAIVLPSMPGGLEGLTSNVTAILQKVQALPLDDMARHLNAAFARLDTLTAAPESAANLRTLGATVAALHDLVHQADAGVAPLMERLPGLTRDLQTALDSATRLLGSAQAGYGGNSQVRRDLERLMDQFSDAARSVRLLADFLDQHPEALLRGRSGQAGAP